MIKEEVEIHSFMSYPPRCFSNALPSLLNAFPSARDYLSARVCDAGAFIFPSEKRLQRLPGELVSLQASPLIMALFLTADLCSPSPPESFDLVTMSHLRRCIFLFCTEEP